MLADTLLEKHMRLVSGAVFGRPRYTGPSLSHTKINEFCQRQCKGCSEICELLRWGEVQRRRDSAYQGCSAPRLVHNSYIELDYCSGVSACDTCRTIRRAFLLEQVTLQDAELLEHPKNQAPVLAILNLSPSGDSLSFTIGALEHPLFSATVHLSSKPPPLPQQDPTRHGARLRPNLTELRRVIDDCHRNHECSSRYRWSQRNPTWLIHIVSDSHIQLVAGPRAPVDYVVLSYSWGDPASMPASEWARIKGAGTKTKDGYPVDERRNPFPIWDLPETMQDAIAISASLGFYYIWIDNVCIPKGTNWDTEASVMHEVYGNAAFTLVASSSTKATDPLLYDRLAWTHRSKACKLRGQWLHNTQMSLDRVRRESPVSQRGWTLQEERLSPRTLYWTSQRWYWVCPERQVTELSELGFHSPTTEGPTQMSSSPQSFLELCLTGDEQQLHEEWLDIVEAYTPRDLVEPRDRFLAIAGLAVRFYTAKAGTGGSVITEEYLAGLWRDNFARHLSWSVATAVDPRTNLQHIAASWSWASLPLRVRTSTKHAFRPSEHFKFLAVEHTLAPPCGPMPHTEKAIKETPLSRAQAVEERGRAIKVVEVQGRFRRFISSDALHVSWEAIERKRGGSRTSFDFVDFSGQHIYARNRADGRIVSKDAHSGEVVGQLDYLVPDEPPMDRFTPYVQEGHEKEIVCLELGQSAMLLLVPNRRWGQPESFRRVGVAVGYGNRKGFFYGCETRRVRLA